MRDHDGVMHCGIRKALRAYRFACDSAGFGADDTFEKEFSASLISVLEAAYASIAKAKAEHAAESDYPKLFRATHYASSDILFCTARLLGHRHGMGQIEMPDPGTKVGAALAARQLTNWGTVFAHDLQRFWEKRKWTRDDLFTMNIHVERVLWPSGIVIWPTPNGTMINSLAAQPPSA